MGSRAAKSLSLRGCQLAVLFAVAGRAKKYSTEHTVLVRAIGNSAVGLRSSHDAGRHV